MPGMTSENTVVPIDFSDLSYAALDRALEISSGTGKVQIHSARKNYFFT